MVTIGHLPVRLLCSSYNAHTLAAHSDTGLETNMPYSRAKFYGWGWRKQWRAWASPYWQSPSWTFNTLENLWCTVALHVLVTAVCGCIHSESVKLLSLLSMKRYNCVVLQRESETLSVMVRYPSAWSSPSACTLMGSPLWKVVEDTLTQKHYSYHPVPTRLNYPRGIVLL